MRRTSKTEHRLAGLALLVAAVVVPFSSCSTAPVPFAAEQVDDPPKAAWGLVLAGAPQIRHRQYGLGVLLTASGVLGLAVGLNPVVTLAQGPSEIGVERSDVVSWVAASAALWVAPGVTSFVGGLITNRAYREKAQSAARRYALQPKSPDAWRTMTAESTYDLIRPTRYFSREVVAEYRSEQLQEAAAYASAEVIRVFTDEATGGEDWDTPLLTAVEHGNVDAARVLLLAGANPDTSVRWGGPTSLQIATEAGDADLVRVLVQAGADTEVTNREGETPLQVAVKARDVQTVRALVDGGANTEVTNRDDETPLVVAARGADAETVHGLVEAGADTEVTGIDATISYWRYRATPLGLAAKEGHVDSVRALVEGGADLEARHDAGDRTPLMSAIVQGHTDVVRLLISAGADVTATDWLGYSLMTLAAASGIPEVVAVLIEAGVGVDGVAGESLTPLRIAMERGSPELVAMLLDAGAPVEPIVGVELNDRSFAPIPEVLVSTGVPPLMWILKHGLYQYVPRFIEAGASSAARNFTGRTPLHYAVCGAPAVIVGLFLGDDVDVRDKSGRTALSLAASDGPVESVALLIATGADVEAPDQWGRTPIVWSLSNNDPAVLRMFLDAGADVAAESTNDFVVPVHRAIHSADLSAEPSDLAAEPADSAISRDRPTVHERARSAAPVIPSGAGPILAAAVEGNADDIRALADAGADVDHPASDGTTALMLAVRYSEAGNVATLLDLGADANVRNDEGLTAWDFAQENDDFVGTDVYWRLNELRSHPQEAY